MTTGIKDTAHAVEAATVTLVILTLGSVVCAIIESGTLGWTSPVILGLLAVAVLSALGLLGYEPRRADPLLFGIFLGTVNPPITNTAVSAMPRSMAGVAASVASAGRQTGTTLGVAISGTIVGSALARGGTAFTGAEHGVWWLVLGLLSTGRWALDTAGRAAALFEEVDRGADLRTAPLRRG